MRAFNQSQKPSGQRGRAKSSCSYCRSDEHQVIECPHVKADWALFQAFTVPCSVADNWTNAPASRKTGQSHWGNQYTTAQWYKNPTGWSKWYAECEKAHAKLLKAEERQANAKNKTKRATKCGFCGSPHHNRRACPSMDALNKRLIRANAHWRQRFYNRMVSDLGLGNGALINVVKNVGSWQSAKLVESVGIVTSINFDEVNMFSYVESATRNWNSRLDHKFQSPVIVKAIVDGSETEVKLTPFGQSNNAPFNDEHGRPLVDVFSQRWGMPNFKNVVSPTEQPLSQEWIGGGQKECVKFVTKKYSLESLRKNNVVSLLENYEKRYNLY